MGSRGPRAGVVGRNVGGDLGVFVREDLNSLAYKVTAGHCIFVRFLVLLMDPNLLSDALCFLRVYVDGLSLDAVLILSQLSVMQCVGGVCQCVFVGW